MLTSQITKTTHNVRLVQIWKLLSIRPHRRFASFGRLLHLDRRTQFFHRAKQFRERIDNTPKQPGLQGRTGRRLARVRRRKGCRGAAKRAEEHDEFLWGALAVLDPTQAAREVRQAAEQLAQLR